MIDLDADLVPETCAAGISIGDPVADLLDLEHPLRVEERIGCRVLDYGSVWVFDTLGSVSQICVFHGYRGKIAQVIGVGSTIAEVESAFGPVIENEGEEFEVPGLSGWSFDIDAGAPPIDSPGWNSARIRWICIARESNPIVANLPKS